MKKTFVLERETNMYDFTNSEGSLSLCHRIMKEVFNLPEHANELRVEVSTRPLKGFLPIIVNRQGYVLMPDGKQYWLFSWAQEGFLKPFKIAPRTECALFVRISAVTSVVVEYNYDDTFAIQNHIR